MATKRNYCVFVPLSVNVSYEDSFFLKRASGHRVFVNLNEKHTNFTNPFETDNDAQYVYTASLARHVFKINRKCVRPSVYSRIHSTGKGSLPRSTLGIGPCHEDGRARPLPEEPAIPTELQLLGGRCCDG